jgi:GNAT superfamily N-acetyltransferase
MNVRPATHADIPEIIRMGRAFWAQTPYSAIPYCPDSIAETCLAMLANNLLLMAEVDGKVAGAVGAVASPLYANKSVLVGAELFWWVEPEHRNSGVGKLMLSAIEDAARAAGVYRFSMMAFDDIEVEKAAAIYSRVGYSPTERSFGKVL